MKKTLALAAAAGALLTTMLTGTGQASAAPLPLTCDWDTVCSLGIGAPGSWVTISVDAIFGADESIGWSLSPSVPGCSGWTTTHAPPTTKQCNLSDGRSYSINAWSAGIGSTHKWDLGWWR